MVVCPQCGRENPADARFCANCGAALTAEPSVRREERKVVSILFADLVGFTSHAEQLDPEDVRATLSPYYAELRGVLERYGGTVEKFIGDAVMAVFGAPVAHEDDPERAVRAALAIRDAIVEDGRLQVRIGVTTGEALVTLSAKPVEGEGMVAGDVVNTAARLQSAAPVNGILVDETTRRATHQRINFGEADPVSAKGKAEPIRVWEAREARSRFGVDVAQTGMPLVGRERELRFLADALGRAREERSTQLVTLVGVPGIGKSRLVAELFSSVVDTDPDLIFWRQGRSLPYGDGVTYWALSEMVKAHAGILENDAPDETERKLSEIVRELGGDEQRLLDSLRPLVGLAADADLRSGRYERFAAWRELFEGIAEQRPTVLVFEDLHWADDDLLDFVDHLVDWAGGVPMLVVCTARPELLERRPAWGGGKQNALTLSVSPLSDQDTARLLGALLERSVLPADVQAALLTHAGGNPLYAEQFARLVAESSSGVGLRLPENVQGIIAARLDGLPGDEKQLLQDAAVVGKVFWLGAVCSVGEREQSDAEQALHSLERKEFVRRERRSSVEGDDEYAFRHVLVRDVAYGQIPRGERAGRHERTAAWLERLGRRDEHAEMLAHHYLEAITLRRAAGEEPSAELASSAREAARTAGERAFALGSYAAAARLFEAALELAPPDDERAMLVLSYARSRVDDVTFDDSLLQDARDTFLGAGDVEAAAEAEVLLGGIWLNRGEREEAVQHLEAGRELVEDRGPSPAKAFALQELARAAMMSGDFERGVKLGVESLRLADRLGLQSARARNLNSIGVSRVHEGDPRGLADLERAAEIAAAAHSHEEVSAVANLAWMNAVLGDLRRSREVHERGLRLAEQLGVTSFVMWQRAELVVHCHWAGRWEEAVTTANDFLHQVEGGSPHYMAGACYFVLGEIELARGSLDGALANATRAVDASRAAGDPQTLNPAVAFAARAMLTAGDRAGANRAADELLALWSESGVRPVHESVDSAWAFVELDRIDEFVQAVKRAKHQTLWHQAARRIAGGDFLGAADTYGKIGTVPDEAYARLRTAEAFVAKGRRADADVQLKLALPVFAQLGATAWSARAEELLALSA